MKQLLRILSVLGTVSLGLSLATAEKVYKWVDDQGIIHYSEQAPANKTATIIKIKSHEGRENHSSYWLQRLTMRL